MTAATITVPAGDDLVAAWELSLHLSPDKHSLFGTGLSDCAANTDTSNDVAFAGKVLPNFAESVIIEAHRKTGTSTSCR